MNKTQENPIQNVQTQDRQTESKAQTDILLAIKEHDMTDTTTYTLYAKDNGAKNWKRYGNYDTWNKICEAAADQNYLGDEVAYTEWTKGRGNDGQPQEFASASLAPYMALLQERKLLLTTSDTGDYVVQINGYGIALSAWPVDEKMIVKYLRDGGTPKDWKGKPCGYEAPEDYGEVIGANGTINDTERREYYSKWNAVKAAKLLNA